MTEGVLFSMPELENEQEDYSKVALNTKLEDMLPNI